jgi:hypothetical protein
MAKKLPQPLVPPEVDLRGMEFMPLKGDILFKSTTWVKGNHEARCAALRLWWHSFAHEVPAASLPDDDTLLSDYAGYGEVLKAWLKIKPQAMRGWIKCSDGRWYHKTVAELALEAWTGRVRNRNKVRKWRERQAASNPDGNGNTEGPVTVTKPVRNRLQSEGQSQSQGQEEEEEAAAAREDGQHPAEPRPRPRTQAAMTSYAETDAAYALWLPVAHDLGISDMGHLNRDRRAALNERLAEIGGIEGWKHFLDKVRNAEFLREADGRPKFWVGLAKLLEPEHFSKLLEGRYAEQRRRHDESEPRNHKAEGLTGRSATATGIAAAFARRSVEPGR